MLFSNAFVGQSVNVNKSYWDEDLHSAHGTVVWLAKNERIIVRFADNTHESFRAHELDWTYANG